MGERERETERSSAMSSSKGRSLLGSALKTSSSNNNPASSATAAASTSGTTQQKHVEWDEENLRVHELRPLRLPDLLRLATWEGRQRKDKSTRRRCQPRHSPLMISSCHRISV